MLVMKQKYFDGSNDYKLVDWVEVRYDDKMKVKTIFNYGFRELEKVGIDKTKLRIRPVTAAHPERHDNEWSASATAAGVKSVLKRVRDTEQQQLDEIQKEIQIKSAELKELEKAKKKMIRQAFVKGWAVQLKDVLPRSEGVTTYGLED